MAQHRSSSSRIPRPTDSEHLPRSNTSFPNSEQRRSTSHSASGEKLSDSIRNRLWNLVNNVRQPSTKTLPRSVDPSASNGVAKLRPQHNPRQTRYESPDRRHSNSEPSTPTPSTTPQKERSLEEIRESLAERESRLCVRLQKLETDCRRFQADMRAAPTGSSSEKAAKTRAVRCMKQIHALKRQLHVTMKMMDNAARVDVARENAAMAKDAVALKHALAYHPQADDVADMMDEQKEFIQNVHEIEQVFATPYGNQDYDDEELSRELDDMEVNQGREPHSEMSDFHNGIRLEYSDRSVPNSYDVMNYKTQQIPNTTPMSPSQGIQIVSKSRKATSSTKRDVRTNR